MVDEQAPERHLTVNDIVSLMGPLVSVLLRECYLTPPTLQAELPESRDFSADAQNFRFDPLLVALCKSAGQFMTKVGQ